MRSNGSPFRLHSESIAWNERRKRMNIEQVQKWHNLVCATTTTNTAAAFAAVAISNAYRDTHQPTHTHNAHATVFFLSSFVLPLTILFVLLFHFFLPFKRSLSLTFTRPRWSTYDTLSWLFSPHSLHFECLSFPFISLFVLLINNTFPNGSISIQYCRRGFFSHSSVPFATQSRILWQCIERATESGDFGLKKKNTSCRHNQFNSLNILWNIFHFLVGFYFQHTPLHFPSSVAKQAFCCSLLIFIRYSLRCFSFFFFFSVRICHVRFFHRMPRQMPAHNFLVCHWLSAWFGRCRIPQNAFEMCWTRKIVQICGRTCLRSNRPRIQTVLFLASLMSRLTMNRAIAFYFACQHPNASIATWSSHTRHIPNPKHTYTHTHSTKMSLTLTLTGQYAIRMSTERKNRIVRA